MCAGGGRGVQVAVVFAFKTVCFGVSPFRGGSVSVNRFPAGKWLSHREPCEASSLRLS